MLALLLFVIHFSVPYPFEKTQSGLGQEGCFGGNAFFAWGWGWADKSLEQRRANTPWA